MMMKTTYFVGMRKEDYLQFENNVDAQAEWKRTLRQESTYVNRAVVAIQKNVCTPAFEESPGTYRWAKKMKPRFSRDFGVPLDKLHIYKETTTVKVEKVE